MVLFGCWLGGSVGGSERLFGLEGRWAVVYLRSWPVWVDLFAGWAEKGVVFYCYEGCVEYGVFSEWGW